MSTSISSIGKSISSTSISSVGQPPLRKQRLRLSLSFLAAEHVRFGTQGHQNMFTNACQSKVLA